MINLDHEDSAEMITTELSLDSVEESTADKSSLKLKKKKNYMQDHSRLILHTWDAQAFVHYTAKGTSPLWQFKRYLRSLWNAHKLDNPYADYFLIKTYRAYVAASKQLISSEKKLAGLFNTLEGIEWELCTNTSPLKFRHQSLTPLDFIGIRLLQQLDQVTRQVLTLKRLGFLPELQQLPNHDYPKIVRAVFHLPESWQGIAVTRADIHDNNEKAQQAKAVLGELPLNILDKQFEFGYWSWEKKPTKNEEPAA